MATIVKVVEKRGKRSKTPTKHTTTRKRSSTPKRRQSRSHSVSTIRSALSSRSTHKRKSVSKQKVAKQMGGRIIYRNKFELYSALPAVAQGFRFKDEASCMPSAAMTLHESYPINYSTGSAGQLPIPSTDFVYLLFRDVLRSAVTFVANPTGAIYAYNAVFFSAGALSSTQVINTDASEAVSIDFVNFTLAGTNALVPPPHGNTLYPGLALGRKAVWLDGDSTHKVGLLFTQGTSKTTAALIVYIWDGSDWTVYVETANFAASVFLFQPTVQGYFSFDYIDTVANTNTIAAIISGTGDVFGHLAVPQVDTQLANLEQVRMNANAVLISDVASELNVEGSVYAAQFPQGVLWYNKMNVTTITQCNNAATLPLRTGIYAFLKPGSNDDYKYSNLITTSGGVVNNSSWDLARMSPFVIIRSSTAKTGTAIPGYDFLLTHTCAIEYVTENQWFETNKSEFDILTRMEAVSRLGDMTQFYENPEHLKKIAQFLGRGAGMIAKNAHVIGRALGCIFPQYASLLGAGGAFASGLYGKFSGPRSRMPALD